jgi:hypothetical protein
MTAKTILGVFFVFAGIFTIIGGVTGNLGVMMAALLDPSDLAEAGSSQQSTSIPGAPGGGGGTTTPVSPALGGGLIA